MLPVPSVFNVHTDESSACMRCLGEVHFENNQSLGPAPKNPETVVKRLFVACYLAGGLADRRPMDFCLKSNQR